MVILLLLLLLINYISCTLLEYSIFILYSDFNPLNTYWDLTQMFNWNITNHKLWLLCLPGVSSGFHEHPGFEAPQGAPGSSYIFSSPVLEAVIPPRSLGSFYWRIIVSKTMRWTFVCSLLSGWWCFSAVRC